MGQSTVMLRMLTSISKKYNYKWIYSGRVGELYYNRSATNPVAYAIGLLWIHSHVGSPLGIGLAELKDVVRDWRLCVSTGAQQMRLVYRLLNVNRVVIHHESRLQLPKSVPRINSVLMSHGKIKSSADQDAYLTALVQVKNATSMHKLIWNKGQSEDCLIYSVLVDNVLFRIAIYSIQVGNSCVIIPNAFAKVTVADVERSFAAGTPGMAEAMEIMSIIDESYYLDISNNSNSIQRCIEFMKELTSDRDE